MSAVHTERSEDEQLELLGWVQEGLAALGVRALLVRRLRLTLAQNRYHPPESDGPVLVAGPVTVSVDGCYVVRRGDTVAVLGEVDETVAYISSLITSASSGGSTESGSASTANHP
ncbi:hypothetical protein ACIBKY_47175 [Nonomuraea sp. NPDC050394]|uniref:hypothetical protein n=1 Tax=Nonomuraea sp. NPDC050394 TaxID=3364363 RepID=UPI0037A9A7F4